MKNVGVIIASRITINSILTDKFEAIISAFKQLPSNTKIQIAVIEMDGEFFFHFNSLVTDDEKINVGEFVCINEGKDCYRKPTPIEVLQIRKAFEK